MKSFLLTFGLLTCILFPTAAHADYSPFVTNFDRFGNFGNTYGLRVSGLIKPGGGEGNNYDGSIINFGGLANPVFGMIYWQGYGPQYWTGAPEFGNANVTMNGHAITGTALPEAAGGEFGLGYYADITNYFLPGNNNYSISGVQFGNAPGATNGVNNGWGLTGVYEDPSARYGRLIIASGNDFAHKGYAGNNGSTRVLGFNIDPVNYERFMIADFSVAGRNPQSHAHIWYYLANGGVIPMNLVGESFANKDPNGIQFGQDDTNFQTYRFGFYLPANTGRLAFQIEADDESMVWTQTTLLVKYNQPVSNVMPEPATMALFASGLGTLALRLRKKKHEIVN